MTGRDTQNLIGGGLLVATGVGFTTYTEATLNLGTLAQMGPGLFPAALGVILALIGAAIFVPALFRSGSTVRPAVGPAAVVAAAILAFALTANPFGLIPAVILQTLIASAADRALGWWKALLLGVVLAAVCSLIFVAGLKLQFPLVHWPF